MSAGTEEGVPPADAAAAESDVGALRMLSGLEPLAFRIHDGEVPRTAHEFLVRRRREKPGAIDSIAFARRQDSINACIQGSGSLI